MIERAGGIASEHCGSIEVPSGRLLLADARGNLTGVVGEVSRLIPSELRAEAQRLAEAKAERREQVLGNLSKFRQRLLTLSDADLPAVTGLIESSLAYSAEGACALLELFGGTRAVVRKDTGDLMLLVTPGTYSLSLCEAEVADESVSILHLELAAQLEH